MQLELSGVAAEQRVSIWVVGSRDPRGAMNSALCRFIIRLPKVKHFIQKVLGRRFCSLLGRDRRRGPCEKGRDVYVFKCGQSFFSSGESFTQELSHVWTRLDSTRELG